MSMIVNVGKIRNNIGASVEFNFRFSNDELSDLNWQFRNCTIDGKIVNTDGSLLLSASVKGEVPTVCDRCLKEMLLSLDFTMEEKLIYVLDLNRFKDLPLDEIEEEYTVFKRDDFDITYLLQENILTNLPTKVLCDEDCKGLCPKCGQNLNEGNCNCKTKKIDPRFAILAKLTEEIEEV